MSAAPAVVAQADPQTMAPLTEDDRAHVVRSHDGGVEPRWVLLHSPPRQPQAQRTVDQQLLKHRAPEGNACKHLCRTALACAADAQQALATVAPGLQATFVAQRTVRPIPRDDKRGRPGQGTPPDRVVYPREGALAMRIAARQALIDHHRCVILATNALDDTRVSPQELFAGYTGQAQAARGLRFLQDPQFLASSRSLKTPERMMALRIVMTVCWLVYAALEDRMRQTLQAHEATVPDQQGQRLQNPTARWVFPSFVGMHL